MFVYADEQGAFPTEGDVPFVAAAIAARKEVPKTMVKSLTLDSVLATLQELDAVVAILYVKPSGDFGARLQRKHDKMEFMGWCTKMIRGRHDYFFENADSSALLHQWRRSVGWRDVMWGFCIRQAVAEAAVGTTTKGMIARVEAVVDSKNMARSTRRFFDDQVDLIRSAIGKAIEEVLGPDQPLWDKNASVRLRLIDEPGTKSARSGLALADVLARTAWNSLRTASKISFLDGRDRRDALHDMTNVLLEPISRDAIEEWKRKTGLPEPDPGI